MMQIRSLHEFGAVVWGSMLTDQKSREIERAQKSALLSFLAPAMCYENTLALEDLDVRRVKLSLSFAKKTAETPPQQLVQKATGKRTNGKQEKSNPVS